MEIGNDPDFGNTHGEALFEYYVRIEGEDVTRSVAQKELALWIHMVALELGKTKLAGEAGTYAKRLNIETAHSPSWCKSHFLVLSCICHRRIHGRVSATLLTSLACLG